MLGRDPGGLDDRVDGARPDCCLGSDLRLSGDEGSDDESEGGDEGGRDEIDNLGVIGLSLGSCLTEESGKVKNCAGSSTSNTPP